MPKRVKLDDNVAEMLEAEVKRSGESRKATIRRLLLKGLEVSRNGQSEGQLVTPPEPSNDGL